MFNKSLTKSPEWKTLIKHQEKLSSVHMRDLFAGDAERFQKFHIEIDGLMLDFSKNIIANDTIEKLCALARAANVRSWRANLFAGERINLSEDRAVLHTALRGSTNPALEIDGENVRDFVVQTLVQMKNLSSEIRESGRYTDVVNIGIGGSDLGPQMVCEALEPFANGPRLHFVSNADGAQIHSVLKSLTPQTTLFIIASKTFSTSEAVMNARTAKEWLISHLGEAKAMKNFIAMTANEKLARDFGIDPNHILPMRAWIGGRYSLWSAIGLSIALRYGFESFQALLDGAKAMDIHFQNAPMEKNMPVILAMLGVWYRNFWDLRAHAVLPYSWSLRRLPAYIQQLDMESNGKIASIDGKTFDYKTGPVVFGEPGTNAQHAFFQLLHQGSDIIPSDFIFAAKPEHDLHRHHIQLISNALAQAQALMQGFENKKEPHRNFPGNRPSSTIIIDRLTPYYLGMLLALYEHKIFVQGALWGINSFDQWGVELGKILAQDIIQNFDNDSEISALDQSTAALISRIKSKL